MTCERRVLTNTTRFAKLGSFSRRQPPKRPGLFGRVVCTFLRALVVTTARAVGWLRMQRGAFPRYLNAGCSIIIAPFWSRRSVAGSDKETRRFSANRIEVRLNVATLSGGSGMHELFDAQCNSGGVGTFNEEFWRWMDLWHSVRSSNAAPKEHVFV